MKCQTVASRGGSSFKLFSSRSNPMAILSSTTYSAFSRTLRVMKASQSKLPPRPSRVLHLLSSRLHLPFRLCARSQSLSLRISLLLNRFKQLHLHLRLPLWRRLPPSMTRLLRNPTQMAMLNPSSRKLSRPQLQLRLKNHRPLSPNPHQL